MTTAVTGATTGTTGTTSTSSSSNQYTSQMFLKLLVTQLQNQDPSSPMDSAAMITQTSQLASMEQLTSLNTSETSSYTMVMRQTAADMIGKSVTYTDSSGNTATGTVSAVSFATTTPTLTVGSTSVSLDDITGVAGAATKTSSTSSS